MSEKGFILPADDPTVSGNDGEEECWLNQVLPAAAALSREEWVPEHQVEVDANEQLNAEVDERESVDLSRKHDNDGLKALVIHAVVEWYRVVSALPDPADLVHERDEDLARADDHPHEAHVDCSLS